mmetsp:Transcript_11849/g.15730  ORF Transcript_11849/g.15730 Transcript_11849/m.15730 type:complete len:119 (+) Transcript_11849:107-463(+)
MRRANKKSYLILFCFGLSTFIQNRWATLAECLKSWDDLSVHWDNFEKLSSPKASSEVFGGEKKDPHRDQRTNCTNEYSSDTHALIKEADSELFRLFQIYSTPFSSFWTSKHLRAKWYP